MILVEVQLNVKLHVYFPIQETFLPILSAKCCVKLYFLKNFTKVLSEFALMRSVVDDVRPLEEGIQIRFDSCSDSLTETFRLIQ